VHRGFGFAQILENSGRGGLGSRGQGGAVDHGENVRRWRMLDGCGVVGMDVKLGCGLLRTELFSRSRNARRVSRTAQSIDRRASAGAPASTRAPTVMSPLIPEKASSSRFSCAVTFYYCSARGLL
jgi:hypothetical protein